MADLVTLADAQTFLGTSLPVNVDTATVAQCVSAASRAVQKWCARDFTRTTYDELYSGQGFSEILLRQYPVNAISRLAINPTTVLTVTNTDTATNQRATVALVATGDIDSGEIVTGLTLTRVASGVSTTNTVTFAANVTLTAVAAAVVALGSGWSAKVATGYDLWPSADLRAPQGAQAAFAANGDGAIFQIHVTDVSAWTLEGYTGRLRLNNQQWDPTFALMNLAGQPLLSTFPPGWQNLRVVYDAGYDTIPFDVQQAVLLTTQDMAVRLRTARIFDSENAKDYSYKLAAPNPFGLPQEAVKLLGPWRSYRRS